MSNSHQLERFVRAQAPVYDTVTAELRRGRKTTHWMWFVFPQLRGIAPSEMSYRYGLASLDEARAYSSHLLLGPRLRECVGLTLAVEGSTAREIFDSPDDWKLHCCLTLFAAIAPEDACFPEGLLRFFGGRREKKTVRKLAELDAE